MIRAESVKQLLGISIDWVEELISTVLHGADVIDFEVFMQFLENGLIVSQCMMAWFEF